mgnify:CR=1 FL=1
MIAEEVYSNIYNVREKHVFKMVFDALGSCKPSSILDVGCATGDFLALASNRFDGSAVFGVDISEKLIELAKKRTSSKDIELICDNFWKNPKFIQKCDVVTCFAVSGYFHDIETFLNPLIDVVGSKGRLFVQGLFNYHDLYVRTNWRNTDGEWEPGLNQLPLHSTITYLKASGFKTHWEDVHITEKIDRDSSFPHRSFSSKHPEFSLENGCHMLLKDVLISAQRLT